MTERHILAAMTYIDSAYIDSAQRKLGYLEEGPKQEQPHRSGGVLRKTMALIAAVMVVMSVLFTTAFAVSEEFRDFVFSFFRIEETEVVPEYTPEEEISATEMFVEPKGFNTGGVIAGKYVHTPAACQARNGMYLLCANGVETKQGSTYQAYYEENGAFVKLESHRFCQEYSLKGQSFPVEFVWAEHNGMVTMTYVDADVQFGMPNQNRDASSVLFWFQFAQLREDGTYLESIYPALLNLRTGEMMDVLKGTGADALDDVVNAAISEDSSKMVLARSDGSLYYADLHEKKLYSVEELSGKSVDSCSLIGDTLACWNIQDGCYNVWTIDLNTFERRELLDQSAVTSGTGVAFMMGFDTWIHEGNMYAGSCFALLTDAARNVSVIDLASGEKTQIEGFVWPNDQYPDIQRIPSLDGKKLLLAGGNAGQNFQYIGVLDFENKTYAEFSRENTNEVREYLVYWFDRNTAIIRASTAEFASDYYVYSIQNARNKDTGGTQKD